MPVLIAESLREDFDQNGPSFPLPREQSARQGQAAILFAPIPVPSRRPHAFPAHGKEVWRCNGSQIGVPGDLVCPPARPFGQIAFGQCLQTPGVAPEQMFPMTGSRFFLKYLLVLFAQSRQCRPAQVLDFHQYRIVHSPGFPSVAVNHSHMDALCRPEGKSKTTQYSLALCRRAEVMGWGSRQPGGAPSAGENAPPFLRSGAAAWRFHACNPLYHHDEQHVTFIPPAQPAHAPAINVIAQLDRPEKPQELRFNMHSPLRT